MKFQIRISPEAYEILRDRIDTLMKAGLSPEKVIFDYIMNSGKRESVLITIINETEEPVKAISKISKYNRKNIKKKLSFLFTPSQKMKRQ